MDEYQNKCREQLLKLKIPNGGGPYAEAIRILRERGAGNEIEREILVVLALCLPQEACQAISDLFAAIGVTQSDCANVDRPADFVKAVQQILSEGRI